MGRYYRRDGRQLHRNKNHLWQNQWFAAQYGNINLPFESGLIQFGLGFKGSSINSSDSFNQALKWRVFKGTAVSSFGLGLSLMETSGGIRVQGATKLAGVFWDADCILLQESYPLPSLSPLSSTRGGAYQYSIRADKLFQSDQRVNFGYSHFANNMDGSAEKTRLSQSLQVNYSGLFAPEFGWLLGYQEVSVGDR